MAPRSGTELEMNGVRRACLGILIVLLASLLAVWPFLSRPGMPQETDAELHIFRTAELSHLLRRGALYPRWAPDFYFGYGYPIFNYYAPLTYYLGAGLTLLPAVDAALAVKLVFLGGLLGAGLGMYAFARRCWGVRPAIVAAVAYLYAPYIQFVDPYARGDLAESFSLALFPWVLWAFTGPAVSSVPVPASTAGRRRAGGTAASPASGRGTANARGVSERGGASRASGWQGQGRWRLPLAAGLLAALVCTHNLMALVLSTVLAAWLLWQLAHAYRSGHSSWRALRTPYASYLVALILGIGLSSFFWMPVFLERNAVQLGNLVSQGGHFDFRNHFLGLGELLQPTPALDLGATEPRYVFNAGVAQWSLGLLGGVSLLWKRTPSRWAGLFFLWGALALLLLVLPFSTPVWERIPLMPLLQFPWRLLGPLSAFLAVLAGQGVAGLEGGAGQRWADWATAGIVCLVLLLAMPLTYPQEWPAEFGRTDPWGIFQRELDGRWLGTTSAGDFLPIDVLVVPGPNEQLQDSVRTGGPVDRVNRVTLPAATSVTLVDERPLAWTYQVDGEKPFVFRLFHFFFPGWVATLDGEPASIEPARPDGLITLEVPSGDHRISISFRDTRVRTAAWAVTGFATALMILATVGLPRLATASARARLGSVQPVSRYLLLAPVCLLVFKLALADPLGWFRIRSEGLEVEGAGQTVYYELGDEIALIGYDWRPADLGQTADLTLYWKATRPVRGNYQVFVHLRNAAGEVVAQSDKLNPGDYPTERWPLDKYVRDAHELSLPAEIPAGEYRLAVGLWLMAKGERLVARDAAGRELGDSLFIETVSY